MKRLMVATAAVLVLATGCGSSDGDRSSATTTQAAAPAPGAAPARIVSLSASATETLAAVGALSQLVAVDSTSNYPDGVPTTDLSAYEPNVEAIANYEPDLVVVDGSNLELIAGLEKIKIPVYVSAAPTDLDGAFDEMLAMGKAAGHAAEAETLVKSLRARTDQLLALVPERETPLTFFHELDELLYTVSSSTFLGDLYTKAGLVNIADEADKDGAAGGYPQLSAEYLLEADPDLVFLADTVCCGQDAGLFGQRPGFDKLSAVKNKNVVELNDDVASRWGPRVVNLLEQIIRAADGRAAGSADPADTTAPAAETSIPAETTAPAADTATTEKAAA